MQSGSNAAADNQWFLLKADIDGNPHFVSVMPHLPSQEVRAAYPVRVTVTVAYEATENGLPMYEDDLKALNRLEHDFRSWDPEEEIFRNAIRSTGGGERKWILYATSADEFENLIPENDFIVVATASDPEWSEVAHVLSGIRK